MRTTPAPVRGVVLADRDRAGRALRVSAHPEAGLVVLSLWDGDRCAGTFRVDPAEVPGLVHALSAAALASQPPRRGAVPTAC
jgi:hypothetical protein